MNLQKTLTDKPQLTALASKVIHDIQKWRVRAHAYVKIRWWTLLLVSCRLADLGDARMSASTPEYQH